jgi:hypothetical protein
VTQLLDMAAQAAVSDQQIWEVVAKIPMEPLPPSRSLYPRLRALLVDCAASIRAQAKAQLDRPRPPAPPAGEEAMEPQAGTDSRPIVIEAEPEDGHDNNGGSGSNFGGSGPSFG